jgi:predicted molibdopterin-dependent oxidoreductase YjgC
MPKSKVIKMAGTITESKSLIQMPCGYEKPVRSGAVDMYIRMHRKGCAICRVSKSQAHVTELQTAGMKSDSFSLEETKQKVSDIASHAGVPLNGVDLDSMIANAITQAKQNVAQSAVA